MGSRGRPPTAIRHFCTEVVTLAQESRFATHIESDFRLLALGIGADHRVRILERLDHKRDCGNAQQAAAYAVRIEILHVLFFQRVLMSTERVVQQQRKSMPCSSC